MILPFFFYLNLKRKLRRRRKKGTNFFVIFFVFCKITFHKLGIIIKGVFPDLVKLVN